MNLICETYFVYPIALYFGGIIGLIGTKSLKRLNIVVIDLQCYISIFLYCQTEPIDAEPLDYKQKQEKKSGLKMTAYFVYGCIEKSYIGAILPIGCSLIPSLSTRM